MVITRMDYVERLDLPFGIAGWSGIYTEKEKSVSEQMRRKRLSSVPLGIVGHLTIFPGSALDVSFRVKNSTDLNLSKHADVWGVYVECVL